MSIEKIITVPDETLKKISEPVEKVGVNEKKLINNLFETMYHSKGIGLAAVQVGVLKRILVIDISTKDEKNKPLSFINPKIKKISDETSIYEEGCLSIPDTFIEIERPKTCEVEYLDINGKIFDPQMGIIDLKNNNVKFIGDPQKRIEEDYLRIIRFIRFKIMYNGKVEPTTIQAIKISINGIKQISKERILSELYKILDLKNFINLKNL